MDQSINKADITPPPELLQQWLVETLEKFGFESHYYIATQAAQWGADRELEACLRLVEINAGKDAYDLARYIRAVRRPAIAPDGPAVPNGREPASVVYQLTEELEGADGP